MRVAIVHYWLLGMRGGESVVESLCRRFPDADIFTLFYDPDQISGTLRAHKITASYLNPFRRHYRRLLAFMPSALESFDLRGYDLVISSESGPAKGVIAPATARHICYCHTPMRYLWELYPDYLNDWTASPLKRALMRPVARKLRVWDYASAARVDRFIANSENVRRRIWKTYRRDATVLYPPVATETFFYRPPEDFFLMAGELVAYKRLDYAIREFSRQGRRLRVAGDGPEYRNLKRQAGSSVEFCGRVSAAELRELYARSRAFVMPGEEDFGITMVESLASGKPVLALGRGGACEIVLSEEPRAGVLYAKPEAGDLARALDRFEEIEQEFEPRQLQSWAAQFSEERFQANLERILAEPDPVGESVPIPFL